MTRFAEPAALYRRARASSCARSTRSTSTPRWACATCWPTWRHGGALAGADAAARVHDRAQPGRHVWSKTCWRLPAPGDRPGCLHLERGRDRAAGAPAAGLAAGAQASCWVGPKSATRSSSRRSCALADHVITGWGDVSFPKLCHALLHGPQPLMKVIAGEQPPLDATGPAVRGIHRRRPGAPAAVCRGLARLPVQVRVLPECAGQDRLGLRRSTASWPSSTRCSARGARNFKFVDRTFNLKIDASLRILQFFLDRLPAAGEPGAVRAFRGDSRPSAGAAEGDDCAFPAGVLQFEVGIQSFNVDGAAAHFAAPGQRAHRGQPALAGRRQSQAHLHADLIFGLPGEDLDSFGRRFRPAAGAGSARDPARRAQAPARHADHAAHRRLRHGLRPAAAVHDRAELRRSALPACSASSVWRATGTWSPIPGVSRRRLALLLAPGSAFGHFLAFSDWLWQSTGKTHEFALEKLVDLLFVHLTQVRELDPQLVAAALLADYQASGARGRPQCLAARLAGTQPTPSAVAGKARAERQGRHLGQQQALRVEIQKAAAAA